VSECAAAAVLYLTLQWSVLECVLNNCRRVQRSILLYSSVSECAQKQSTQISISATSKAASLRIDASSWLDLVYNASNVVLPARIVRWRMQQQEACNSVAGKPQATQQQRCRVHHRSAAIAQQCRGARARLSLFACTSADACQ